MSGLLNLIQEGGFVMAPLLICSLTVWAIIFERAWRFKRLGQDLRSFRLEALNTLLRGDQAEIRRLCSKNERLPTSELLQFAIERLDSKDQRLRAKWQEALERRRVLVGQELKRNLWVLGTIASASPFIGLFGTVVGILRSFHDIAQTGKGGFAVVASGISEALIATAAGILVAVVASMAFNAFQTRWAQLVLLIRIHVEEFAELLEVSGGPERTEK